eukprot:11662806-Ditylum_brightwellii.AAC.1
MGTAGMRGVTMGTSKHKKVVAKYNKTSSHHPIANGENPVRKHCCDTWEHKSIPYIDIIKEEDGRNIDGVDS